MKKLFLSFIILLALFQLSATSSDALTTPGNTPNHFTDITFCNDDPTDWQVNANYRDMSPTPHWILLGTSFSINEYPGTADCPGIKEVFEFADAKPEDGDYVRWFTACVDPDVDVDLIPTVYRFDGGVYVYETNIPVQCKAMGAGGTPNRVYAGCYNLPYNTTDYGTVGSGSQCPYRDSNDSYCTKGGITAYPSLCGNSYCGGAGGCTYYNKTCSGTSCSHPSTQYAAACSSGGSDCAPPPPTVTGTPSCSAGAGRISTSWSSVLYSDGVYDFRYRRSTTSTWTYDYDAPEPKVLSGLASNATYYVQVRSHTTSGHAGPTDWGSDTVVTGDCDAPNLSFSAFTYPTNIYAGDSGNASVTVTNTGATSTGVGFNVAVINDGTSASCATDESIEATNPNAVSKITTSALGAGASRTLSVPVTYPTTTGAHTAVAMADADCAVAELSEPDNDRTDAYTVLANTLTLNVYQDLNGNGADDGGTETGYSGANIIVTGTNIGSATSSNCTRQSSSSLSCTTNASGQIVISTILPGSTTANLTVPTGFTSTTTDPRTTTFPPSQTINFGIQPAAPTCSGGLTASPVTVNPGQVSTLTANGCTTPAQGATLTYTWLTPAPGSITSTNPSLTSTATWRAPTPYWTDIYSYPTVNVCQTGTTLCRPYAISNGLGVGNQGIHIVPLFTVSGNVFVDQNKDSLQNGADGNYTGGISITPNPAGVTVTYPTPGSYVINNMPGGQYTISYPSLPTGYQMTYPKNGPPPSFTVRVGNVSTGGACSVSGHNAAACDVNGNITALRYGITNSIPWIQSTGGDITGNEVTDPSGGGISNTIPPGASCGPYMSLTGSGGTPGVIYAGAGSYSFGSGQASPNPYNWVIGGLSYPDTYIPTTPGVIRTSYGYMRSLATQSGLTPVDIAGYCGAGGISNCTLSSSIPNGLYISNGNLTLTGASYTFPANRNFVILVNGNLTINTEVHVPIGSTAFFTTSGDISVGSNVGETVITSTRSNIEGYYSTDRSFYSLGLNACPTVDRRLNVAGSIVVNASLTGGSFVNQRDLCAGDLQCPVFMVIERPDFVLNSPEFLKSARRVWREIAP